MRGDVDLKDISLKRFKLTRGQWAGLIALVVVLGGGWAGWHWLNHPLRPWLVRWKLDRYLRSESHARTFQVSFPFPSAAEMAAPKARAVEEAAAAKGARTGKEFEPLREEYLGLKIAAVKLEREVVRAEGELAGLSNRLARLHVELSETQGPASAADKTADLRASIQGLEKRLSALAATAARRAECQRQDETLAPMVEDLWELQKLLNASSGLSDSSELARARDELLRTSVQKLEAASSYESMYRIIGEELFVAQKLRKSGNPAHRRLAVTIAQAAARHALNYTVNGHVAGRIVEGYLLPEMPLATDANPRSPFNPQVFLDQCAGFFRQNNEFNNVVRTYELALAKATSPARADWARSQVAGAYQQAGDFESALTAVRQIQDTNAYRGLIRNLERSAQNAGR